MEFCRQAKEDLDPSAKASKDSPLEHWGEGDTAATTLKPRGDILPPLLRTLDSRDYILDDTVGHK